MQGAVLILTVLLFFVGYGVWRVRKERHRWLAKGVDGGSLGYIPPAIDASCDPGSDGACGDGGGGGD